MKTCSVCRESRPLFEFVKESRKKDGLSSRCKPCHRAKTAPYEAVREYTPEQRQRKADYLKAYASARKGPPEWQAARRDANDRWQERAGYDKAAKNREWKARNKARVLEQTRHRQALQARAVPPWCDRAKVREIYDLAAEFRAAGIQVDVDHIVPLRGAGVCGLHWHGNLRVCLTEVNQSKGNRLVDL